MSPADALPTPDGAAPEADAVARLLARPAEPEYLAAWVRTLGRALFDRAERGDLPALLIRLGAERYLLATECAREVHPPRRVHRLPGRTNDVLRGLVCLRGELLLCADLHALLGVNRANRPAGGEPRARMVVLERGPARWAVEVDEVLDVRRYERSDLVPPPVTVARAAAHLTDASLPTREGRAAHVDVERLFAALARSLA